MPIYIIQIHKTVKKLFLMKFQGNSYFADKRLRLKTFRFRNLVSSAQFTNRFSLFIFLELLMFLLRVFQNYFNDFSEDRDDFFDF